MSDLTVRTGDASYPIHIGPGLVGDPSVYAPHIGTGGAVIVTNETVAPLYLKAVQAALGDTRQHAIILPDGESHKTAEVLATIWDELIAERFSRDVTILALGGGVIGDMAGFAAATYKFLFEEKDEVAASKKDDDLEAGDVEKAPEVPQTYEEGAKNDAGESS